MTDTNIMMIEKDIEIAIEETLYNHGIYDCEIKVEMNIKPKRKTNIKIDFVYGNITNRKV